MLGNTEDSAHEGIVGEDLSFGLGHSAQEIQRVRELGYWGKPLGCGVNGGLATYGVSAMKRPSPKCAA